MSNPINFDEPDLPQNNEPLEVHREDPGAGVKPREVWTDKEAAEYKRIFATPEMVAMAKSYVGWRSWPVDLLVSFIAPVLYAVLIYLGWKYQLNLTRFLMVWGCTVAFTMFMVWTYRKYYQRHFDGLFQSAAQMAGGEFANQGAVYMLVREHLIEFEDGQIKSNTPLREQLRKRMLAADPSLRDAKGFMKFGLFDVLLGAASWVVGLLHFLTVRPMLFIVGMVLGKSLDPTQAGIRSGVAIGWFPYVHATLATNNFTNFWKFVLESLIRKCKEGVDLKANGRETSQAANAMVGDQRQLEAASLGTLIADYQLRRYWLLWCGVCIWVIGTLVLPTVLLLRNMWNGVGI